MNSQRRRKQLWFHESTQRVLVRSLLLFLAILPMLGTAGFVVATQTRWYQLRQSAAWRERIRNNLGLDVVFGAIEFPAPNRFRIRELVCAHPETQTPILRAATAEGVMTSNGWGVELSDAEIIQDQSDLAVRILHDSFLCRPHKLVPILKLSINRVQLLPGSSVPFGDALPATIESLHDVLVEYSPSLERSEIKIQAGLEEVSNRSPLMVHVLRHHHPSNPTTEWAVDTHEESIPCAPFAPYFSALQSLGPQATFHGKVSWQQDSGGWGSRIHQGLFSKVSWQHLTAGIQTPMKGYGQLRVYNGSIRNGILQQMEGSMESAATDRTTVQTEWVQNFIQTFHLGSDGVEHLAKLNTSYVSLDQLSIGFELSSEGVRWRGRGAVIPGESQNSPSHSMVAVLENGFRIASNQATESTATPLSQVGMWLASSQTPSPSGDMVARWQARLSTMLPPPAINARLSDARFHGMSMDR